MITAAIIIGIVLIFLVMLNSSKHDNFDKGLGLSIAIVITVFIETILISCIRGESIPTAMDVYQGNTELEIISVNGVPTDTVVVFKNK